MGYKVKPPKCGCEFWRRERRVKKAPHPEILIRKLEIKRLKCSIQNVREIISDTIRQQGRAGGLVLEYAEAIREKNRFGIDLADFDTRPMKTSSKSWKQYSRRADKLCDTLIHLQELRNKLHRECLEIRFNERKCTGRGSIK